MLKQKRIAAIHDISCFGKCSLTVALPVLSAASFETCCIPTAVLSTHTGGFTGYTYRDLSEDILPIASHWQSLNLHFDSVYTGFLASTEQVSLVEKALSQIANPDCFIFVDPVMGDNGNLYPVFADDFPKAMLRLCQKANVIVPNMTEAYLLLDKPYQPGPYTPEEIDALLAGLSKLGAEQIVLTGVHFHENELGAAVLDCKTGAKDIILREKVDGFYHGTGDVYASSLLAALLHGFSLKDAATIATDYTVLSVKTTKAMDKALNYGVNFEYNLPTLMRMLGISEEPV